MGGAEMMAMPRRLPGAVVRRGFTLLEVILALAILAGAIAVLSAAVSLGSRHAAGAVALQRAELLAASKIAQTAAGVAPASAARDVPCENEPGFRYSVEVSPL